MRFLITMPLLVWLVVGYPYGINKTVITTNDYPEHLVIYEGKHDIVDIMVPLNALNEYDSPEHNSTVSSDKHHMIFFREANINHRRDYGIYVYTQGKVIKIMDKGTAIASSYDDSENVYLGAKDGLYVYNPKTQKADPYSKFDKSIKGIASEQYSDVIYVLTDDGVLYKVYDFGTKITKVNDVKGAEQIMLDYSNNLYYYGKDKKLYVRTVDGETIEVEGIPTEENEVRFLRPLLFNSEEVGVMVDNQIYTIFSDGSSQSENVEFMPDAQPTAFSMEAGIYHYFGYQKKIYEYKLSLKEDYMISEYESESKEA